MEVIFGTAKNRFTSSHIGGIDRGQRFSGPAWLMRQFADAGLVVLEESKPKKPSVVGEDKPPSVLPVAEALPTKTAKGPKPKGKKKTAK
jgi:hypothetical protein